MKKLPAIPSAADSATGLKRRMSQLGASPDDGPFEPPQTPFDKYYRKKLLKKLRLEQVNEKSVLEVGCGVGDLLKAAATFQPKELYGVDQSPEAIEIAQQYLQGIDVDLGVAPVSALPFPDQSFDMVFVMFELQHIPNKQLLPVIEEVCRVPRQWIVLIEETAAEIQPGDGLIYRPVELYKEAFKTQKFHLRHTEYLDVAVSRSIVSTQVPLLRWLRWVFSPLLYLLGFPSSWMKPPSGSEELPPSKWAGRLQKILLALTAGLDDVLPASRGITIMRFEREKLFRR
ncbi:MAG: class I SAM-dependent methyltransferase [Saprospiraceae bacterium]